MAGTLPYGRDWDRAMMTIRDVLSRVQWDPEFGAADFALGCFDRVRAQIERVPLAQVRLTAGNWFSFQVEDDNSLLRTIPFHRVREVYRNGERIWSRPGAQPGPAGVGPALS